MLYPALCAGEPLSHMMELMPHSMRRRQRQGGGGGGGLSGHGSGGGSGRYAVVNMAGLDDGGGRSALDGEGTCFHTMQAQHNRIWVAAAGLDPSGTGLVRYKDMWQPRCTHCVSVKSAHASSVAWWGSDHAHARVFPGLPVPEA